MTKTQIVSQTVIAEDKSKEDVQVVQIRGSCERRVGRDTEKGVLHAKSQVATASSPNTSPSKYTKWMSDSPSIVKTSRR